MAKRHDTDPFNADLPLVRSLPAGSAPDRLRTFRNRPRRSQFMGTIETIDPKTGEVKITTPPSLTKQDAKAECDINNIMKQFSPAAQRQILAMGAQAGTYDDLPDQVDFQESMNLVAAATEAFESLPSRVRERFQNNPGRFLEFINDPKSQAEAIELGLAVDTRSPPSPPAPPEKPSKAPKAGGGAEPRGSSEPA